MKNQSIATESSGQLKTFLDIFEQNVTTDRYEDFDGERWAVLGDA
ncbi:hypothetical protein CLNEO_10530 [Anaerotignum neopropionicum]|uniref:Uncharacterized protein n=1 Tax=Anaerotignum neopropionicum TaxID=36847 RepID=A0A136WH78_9FIRM|nr:hypothetical protein [Anaerotignum neopropionicum]KXL53827.1 hypothetical protein CLNEO_10530 [Anaerotignum neopropionicum]